MGRRLLLGSGALLGNGLYRLAGFCVSLALRAGHELLLGVAPLMAHPEELALGRRPFTGLLLAIRLFELRHLGVAFGALAGGPLRVVLSLIGKRGQTSAHGALEFATLFLLGNDRRRFIVLGGSWRPCRMTVCAG